MHARGVFKQTLDFVGAEFADDFSVSKVPSDGPWQQNRILLSSRVFPQVFLNGEEIDFFVSDRTPNRVRREEKVFGMRAEVFYGEQQPPATIILGNSYERAEYRSELRRYHALAALARESQCGLYRLELVKELSELEVTAIRDVLATVPHPAS